MRASTVAIVFLVGGCGGEPAIQSLYGEVHIHQFADGSHIGALFVRTPVPAASIDGDEILIGSPPTRTEGTCTFTRLDGAAPTPPPALTDDGAIHLRGDHTLDLVWNRALLVYLPQPAPPAGQPLFAGGVRVHIESDGGSAPPFSGSVTTPPPLTLVAPRALALGDGTLTISWIPAHADRVTINLVVSTADGRAALIQCRADDPAGSFVVPRTLLDDVPERPRDLQLEVSRDQVVRVASRAAGQGVVLHAGYEAALAAHEP